MLKIAYDPIYSHPLPAGHKFPMEKYDLLPRQLLYEGTANEENFFRPEQINPFWITRIHDQNYWKALSSLTLGAREIRRIGFPLSEALINRETLIASGTIACSIQALENGIAMNIAGGTHHAFRDKGEGYCLLNDQAIAANYLLENKLARQILIIDLDVHQGNGTASIFYGNDQVFTFSMHGATNFPYHKEISDLDLALPDGMGDQAYLDLLTKTLPALISRVKPDFVFYLAGVDVLETDRLGKLALSRQGCRQRDLYTLSLCKKNDLPVVVCLGGGYSVRLTDIIEAHANTFRVARDLYF